jgi:hypothetical protein
MGAGRTPFADSGTPASFDDEPFARAVIGAFATCTDFASSIVLCDLLEDGLPVVALRVEVSARVPEERSFELGLLVVVVVAGLVRAGIAMPLR